jgi:hypothetical protein
MFFISDCGKYIARKIEHKFDPCCFDVMTIDGSKMWLWLSLNSDKLYGHVICYSLIKLNESGSVWVFKLTFSGNNEATFRRKIKLRTPKIINQREK